MKDNIPWWTKNNLLFQDHLLCTLTPSPVSLNTFNSSRTLPPSGPPLVVVNLIHCNCYYNNFLLQSLMLLSTLLPHIVQCNIAYPVLTTE